MSPDDKRNAAAAAIIMLVFGGGFIVMPKIVLWLGNYSPWLGGLFGVLFVMAFFGIFWLRRRLKSGDN